MFSRARRAYTIAVNEMVPLSRSHLETFIYLEKGFEKDHSGAGQMASYF